MAECGSIFSQSQRAEVFLANHRDVLGAVCSFMLWHVTGRARRSTPARRSAKPDQLEARSLNRKQGKRRPAGRAALPFSSRSLDRPRVSPKMI